jgi:hypothetical protein
VHARAGVGVDLARHEGAELRLGVVRGVAPALEEDVHRLHERGRAAEARLQVEPRAALLEHELRRAPVDVEVGAAEAVDRLLRVADEEEATAREPDLLRAAGRRRARRFAQEQHELALQRVGVLEFVDEQLLERRRLLRANAWMADQQPRREGERPVGADEAAPQERVAQRRRERPRRCERGGDEALVDVQQLLEQLLRLAEPGLRGGEVECAVRLRLRELLLPDRLDDLVGQLESPFGPESRFAQPLEREQQVVPFGAKAAGGRRESREPARLAQLFLQPLETRPERTQRIAFFGRRLGVEDPREREHELEQIVDGGALEDRAQRRRARRIGEGLGDEARERGDRVAAEALAEVDLDAGRDPRFDRMAAQQAQREGVDRAERGLGLERGGDPRAQRRRRGAVAREAFEHPTRFRSGRCGGRGGAQVGRARDRIAHRRKRIAQPLPHLRRGLLRERDRRDPLEQDPAREQRVQDALDQEARLARPGAGDDAEVAREIGDGLLACGGVGERGRLGSRSVHDVSFSSSSGPSAIAK